ncbi:FGGY-family carbohydrate kinase [Spirosoma telluris]|uniref:FGGY-family carbohydrate kinase n=1 Tax=Spirosoma telluris TaxID=2183553 RepID=UPI002FC3C15D
MSRKASISGLTFGTSKNHIVRAALESIPYQIKDVIVAMEQDTGISLEELMVNGGISANKFVLQFLSDLLGKSVVNKGMPDISAQGAAYLAGLKAGVYKDLAYLTSINLTKETVRPGAGQEKAIADYAGWQAALKS